jgi:hypothetical protein
MPTTNNFMLLTEVYGPILSQIWIFIVCALFGVFTLSVIVLGVLLVWRVIWEIFFE